MWRSASKNYVMVETGELNCCFANFNYNFSIHFENNDFGNINCFSHLGGKATMGRWTAVS